MKNLLSAFLCVLLASSLLFAAKAKVPKAKKGPKKGSQMYGWREDIVFALETAEGKRDARGRVVGKGKSPGQLAPKPKKGMVGPACADGCLATNGLVNCLVGDKECNS